jgi:AraC family transcriptional regulator
MEPRITRLEKMSVVGVTAYGEPSTGIFTKTWDIFLNLEKRFTWKNENVGYGIEFYTDEFFNENKWFYMAAMEVDSLSDIPTTLVGKVILAHTYCVFNCRGGIAELGNVFRYAYDKWIPGSKYEVADCYDFELYDERFKGADNPETEIDIYIPIKEK